MRCFRHFNLHEAEGTASAVYSLDLSPGGDTLATCGGDSLVRLWSCGVVFAGGGNDAPEAVPEAALAATLAKHTAVVTSVRWSGAGHRLASGSDDTFVFVWEPRAGGAWARAATLRGHGADVLDVAWSADDAMIASCSIDNSVCVWDARNLALLMAPLRTLRGHANWVKGVAWDPTGRFLASASEDRRVLVWRASGDWRVEATIEKPFAGVTSQTFFQRLSWAPDGASLGVPNAAKSMQACAAVVARGSWDGVADLVGHKHPVTVVKFCPALFVDDDTGGRAPPRSVVAIGGQDATISVWTSSKARPVVVFRDCFSGAVSDLAWSRDGSLLVAASHDGSTCAFRFDVGADLGEALSADAAAAYSPTRSAPRAARRSRCRTRRCRRRRPRRRPSPWLGPRRPPRRR
ncbi:hypothetical protein JL721_7347 [Aureococcus anophagefferens]|nr:hypothetical protein JL721_7347 [Aureococcus anophagefferens]